MPRLPLQQFDHDRSSYERPNLDWSCGRAACGRPCALGPDHKGNCHTVAECVPSRAGDRWQCTRAGSLGGKCEAGPRPDGSCCWPIVPCSPVRSMRFVRGSITRWVAAISLGVVLLTLGLPGSGEVFSPGPLLSAHASLRTHDIKMAGASQCSACHAESNSIVAQIFGSPDWERSGLAGSGVGPVVSEKCMECHRLGVHAYSAHGVNPGAHPAMSGERPTDEAGLSLGLRLARSVGVGVHALHHAGTPIECVACHSDHHGPAYDITMISEQQCQTCHAQAFESFYSGHPEFDGYPYDTPARIKFNHATHSRTHFKNPEHASTFFSCMTCHEPDRQASAMLSRGYETSCMDCHEGQIMGEGRASVQGITFLTLPPIDVRSLDEGGGWIGEWPADSAIYSGGLTPFMKLLLAGDDEVVRALARTDERTLRDLYGADEQTLRDAETIAWGVKRLMHDLLVGGQGEARSRIERALRHRLTSDEAAGVLAGLPLNAMVGARDAWFPMLHNEIAMYDAGIRPAPPAVETPADTPALDSEDAAAGDDDLLGGDDGLLDRSDDLLGGDDGLLDGSDDLLGGDDDLLGGSDDLLGGDDGLLDGSDDLLGGDDDLLGGSDDLLGGDDDLLDGSDDLLGGDDGLLDGSGDPLGGDDGLLGGSDDLLGGDDGLLGGSDDLPGGEDIDTPTFDDSFTLPDPQQWVEHGGWFLLDAESLSLVYRPTGHADRFMQSWLDLSVSRFSVANDGLEPAVRFAVHAHDDVYNQLSDPGAPGVCMKCHSVDSSIPEAPAIAWHAIGPDDAVTTFTRFTHGPHLTDLGDNSCAECHDIASLLPFDAPDEREQACFSPMSIEGCQSCHDRTHVETSCLGCHNYHVGVVHVRARGGAIDTSEPGDALSEGERPPRDGTAAASWRRTAYTSPR